MDKETIDRIVDRFRRSLEKQASSGKRIRTIDEIEAAAMSLREEAASAVVEELASSSLKNEEEESSETKTECHCGCWARYKGLRSHTSITMAGRVVFERRYYYCRRCNAGFCPVDMRLGIRGSAYTSQVQQQASRLCTLAPYTVATDLFWDLCGVRVSVSHAQRMVEQADIHATQLLADRVEAAEQAERLRIENWGKEFPAPICPKGVNTLYVEMDGVQTPLVDGWSETKVGVCFSVSPKGRRSENHYVSHLGSSQEFAPHLYALAVENGVETARRIVILGDGAHWIWNLAEEQFPGCIQVLDLWHVLDRLGKVARQAFGEDNTPAITRWLDERKQELKSSQLKAVEQALRSLAQEHPNCAELVRSELGYHKNNTTRMDYASYISEGIFIGSGVAESACKRVVTQRLKGAGMRWVRQGADAMARLRCLMLSQQWNKLIDVWKAGDTNKRLSYAI
jgi:hypothetical protein